MATGANIAELSAINAEFARMAHLGPQCFRAVAESAMKLSRTTDMNVESAAKFTLNLRQMYRMNGPEADRVATQITVLSKLSGVSADTFAEIYDGLKFTRFALDGNVQSAKRLAESVAEAAAEMGKYGVSAQDVLKDVKGRTTGGVDEYTKNLKSLVMGGKTISEARALLDAEAREDKGATAEIAKTKGRAYNRFVEAGGGGAFGRAYANQLASGVLGMDVEEAQKFGAYARGDMKGPVEEFIKNPASAKAREQKKAATADLMTASEARGRAVESAAGATALSQQTAYQMEIEASKALMNAAKSLESVTGALGHAGTNFLGTAAQVGVMAIGAKTVWQGAKAVLNLGKGAGGAAGAVGGAAEGAGLARSGGGLVKGAAGKVAARVAALGSKLGPGTKLVGKVAGKAAGAAMVGYDLGTATRDLLKAWVEKKEADADAADSDAQAKYQKLQLYKKQISKAQETGDTARVKSLRERMSKEFGTRASGPAAAASAAPVPETPMKMGEAAKAGATSSMDKALASTVENMAKATTENAEGSEDSAKAIRDYMSQAAIYAGRAAVAFQSLSAGPREPASAAATPNLGLSGGAAGGRKAASTPTAEEMQSGDSPAAESGGKPS